MRCCCELWALYWCSTCSTQQFWFINIKFFLKQLSGNNAIGSSCYPLSLRLFACVRSQNSLQSCIRCTLSHAFTFRLQNSWIRDSWDVSFSPIFNFQILLWFVNRDEIEHGCEAHLQRWRANWEYTQKIQEISQPKRTLNDSTIQRTMGNRRRQEKEEGRKCKNVKPHRKNQWQIRETVRWFHRIQLVNTLIERCSKFDNECSENERRKLLSPTNNIILAIALQQRLITLYIYQPYWRWRERFCCIFGTF